MSENILLKEVTRLANEQKIALWEDIINDLSEVIISNYDGKNEKTYRGDWKRKIKAVIKSMGYELKRFDNNVFVPLETSKSSDSLNNKSSDSNYKLKDCELKRVIDFYQSIPVEEKWVLTTGKVVNDEMTKLAKSSSYEHPLGKELYLFADTQVHNHITKFTKKWVRESVVRASELFLYDDTLWPFVYRIFKDKSIKAALGERASIAVALDKNDDGKLEAIDKRSRKNVGAKVDILFKICNSELGSCEVGLTLELVILDCPVGNHITRVSITLKLDFPSTISTISLDLIPLLEISGKGEESMNKNIEILNIRKRRVAHLVDIDEEEKIAWLPYSFTRSSYN
ncbi:hypothetical protein EDC94DRAFT_640527 [Helicostylum pulchrum]|nr:hypothetical protein EDC94DRAFT_640527 [Helicostylum pulchrum]